MKSLLFTLMICTLVGMTLTKGAAQGYNFLTVVIDRSDESPEKVVYYPEGSTFRVVDTQGVLVDPIESSDGAFTYTGDLQLIINPEYRKEKPDWFGVIGKRLRVFTTAEAAYNAGFGAGWNGDSYGVENERQPSSKSKLTDERGRYIGEVKLSKKLTPSKTRPGKYNVQLTFDNGIEFSYLDGTARASLEGEELKVLNKYIIESKLGIARLSFNPDNGVVWYVFEPK